MPRAKLVKNSLGHLWAVRPGISVCWYGCPASPEEQIGNFTRQAMWQALGSENPHLAAIRAEGDVSEATWRGLLAWEQTVTSVLDGVR